MKHETLTQGQIIVRALRRRSMTYMEMMQLGVSVCPWKRVGEALRLDPALRLVKGKRKQGGLELVTWRIVKQPPCAAA
jgi:hypothetical protein